MPDTVRTAALAYDLGARCLVHRVTPGRMAVTAAKGILTAALTAFLAYLCATAAADGSIFPAVLTGALAVAGVVFLATIVRAVRATGDTIYRFDSGLVHQRRAATRVFRWDDVQLYRDVVRNVGRGGGTVSMEYTYTVRRPDGEAVVLDHNMYWDIAELAKDVEQAVIDARFPLAIQTVMDGGTVGFGRFGVDLAGIRDGDDVVRWDDVDRVEIADGYIGIEQLTKRRTPRYPVRSIPNVVVFAGLVETVLGATRR
ncbi:DUF6585 family protein [Pseudonocardia sp. TRM90224]|uniref:DUF6585 family protein n=1 Tax=Pseudonocardia sp. TRM90224 TaxID=2812678 RepID=UPI001E63237F|nr:DUF6585 family protein [Pseudonocardia sp. TRM90224]